MLRPEKETKEDSKVGKINREKEEELIEASGDEEIDGRKRDREPKSEETKMDREDLESTKRGEQDSDEELVRKTGGEINEDFEGSKGEFDKMELIGADEAEEAEKESDGELVKQETDKIFGEESLKDEKNDLKLDANETESFTDNFEDLAEDLNESEIETEPMLEEPSSDCQNCPSRT